MNFIEDTIFPHGSDSLRKECNIALKTSPRGSKTTFLPIKLQQSIIQAAMYAASIRIYLITPFEEAYEIRYMATDNQNCYQSEPIPILYSKDEHESSKTQVTQIKQYSIHGGIQGTIKDNFPEVAREFDD